MSLNQVEEPRTKRLLNLLYVILLIIVIASIIFYFTIFTNENLNTNLKNNSAVGDALGGGLSPMIALAGVILTFFAFYIQYKFNETQFNIYKESIIQNKRDNFLKLVESIIIFNKIDDRKTETDFFNYLVELNKTVGKKNPTKKFKSIYNLFAEKFEQEIKYKESFKTLISRNIDDLVDLKLKDLRNMLETYRQYFNLLSIYDLELGHLKIDPSLRLVEMILLDNKFDILFRECNPDIKSLLFTYNYVQLTKSRESDVAFQFEQYIKLKFGQDDFDENMNFINHYLE